MSNQDCTTKIEPIKDLGEKIKQARLDVGLSQKELGQALQLSDKAISSYEVGRAEPNLSTLKQISHLTGQPVSYFLDESTTTDYDLQLKLRTIEKELLAVKKMVATKKKDK